MDDTENLENLFISLATNRETLGTMSLLCEGSDTDGAMAVVKHSLPPGGNGAHPHFHNGFSEMLYVIEGTLNVLGAEKIVKIEKGEMVVVPRRMVHAFASSGATGAEYLLVIAPGIDRFEYHRTRRRLREAGLPSPDSLQETYDNHNVDSDIWNSFLSSKNITWF